MVRPKWLAIFHHPLCAAAVGLVLAVTGLVEVGAALLDGDPGNDWSIQSQHGVSVFGIVLFVRSLGDALLGWRLAREGAALAREALGGGPSGSPEGVPGR